MRLHIYAVGRPAPQGSHDLGSAGQFLDASPYLKAWRQAVVIASWRACSVAGVGPSMLPLFPAGTPVEIEQCTFYVKDDQCRATGTDLPIGKPDIDKLLRATLDGLGGAGKTSARLFEDDSQVVGVRQLSKQRPAPGSSAGAYIVITDGRD